MTPDQAAEQIKRYSQLYPTLQPEVLARVREEFERHELAVVESVVRQLWRESEVFSDGKRVGRNGSIDLRGAIVSARSIPPEPLRRKVHRWLDREPIGGIGGDFK